jgi:hypothetical protein
MDLVLSTMDHRPPKPVDNKLISNTKPVVSAITHPLRKIAVFLDDPPPHRSPRAAPIARVNRPIDSIR